MDQSEYEKIIQSAISNEIEAQEFYAAAAQKVEDPYLKSMFGEFAIEEKKHEELLKRVLSSDTMTTFFNETVDYKVSETVEEPALTLDLKPADAIALAMKKEEAAMKGYTELANNCPDSDQKRVFEELAAMERGHKLKLEKAFVDIGYPEAW